MGLSASASMADRAKELLRRIAMRNLETRDAWHAFTDHREQVMSLIEGLPPGGRLGILGAGNANDIDLPRLLDRFEQVHLVDLDSEAVMHGVAAQQVDPARVSVHGGVDLTGVADLLDRWFGQRPDDVELDASIRRIGKRPEFEAVGGPFDVLVSTCVLTQLIDACVDAVGQQHPRITELVLAVRDQHLRTLVGATLPNGFALLVTDMVSSDTAPELATLPPDRLPELMMSLIEQRDFFTGTNPVAIQAALTSNPSLAPFVASVALHRPWRWDLGRRSYLVYALSVRRR